MYYCTSACSTEPEEEAEHGMGCCSGNFLLGVSHLFNQPAFPLNVREGLTSPASSCSINVLLLNLACAKKKRRSTIVIHARHAGVPGRAGGGADVRASRHMFSSQLARFFWRRFWRSAGQAKPCVPAKPS
jgi:hypothetical protein